MQMTTRGIWRLATLAALAALGAALARLFVGRSHDRRNAAFSVRADREVGDGAVRPAGPEAMRDPPRQWTERDEVSDESFPASDPPSTY